MTQLPEDLRLRVKDKRSPLEKVMSIIPLYHGYKEKELRREADRLIRRHVHLKLESVKNDLRQVQKAGLKSGNLEGVARLDDIITNIDTCSQRIDRAVHGFSGFWDAVKVKEDELDGVYDNDWGLLETSDTVAETASATRNSGSASEMQMDTINNGLRELERGLDTRERILRGMKSFE